MDQVTQQNAALVEQSAAAAESLEEQARTLAGTVGKFKLAGQPDAEDAGLVEERRGQDRAQNVARLGVSRVEKGEARAQKPAQKRKAAAGGNEEGWEQF